jgi:uncharacterized protein
MLPNLLTPETHALQSTLARICRTGEMEPLPGIHSEERITTYREIVLTAFSNSLARAYPIAKKALGDSAWDTLVRLFIAKHDVLPVELWKMPEGLYEFVCSGAVPSELNPIYLKDLLLFEWVEIAVTMMEDLPIETVSVTDPLVGSSTWDTIADQIIFVNPHFEVIKIDYPLYKLSPNEAIQFPGEYFVVCFRHCTTLKPHYLTVTPLIAQVLLSLKEQPLSLLEVTTEICAEFEIQHEAIPRQQLVDFLMSAHTSGLILAILPDA